MKQTMGLDSALGHYLGTCCPGSRKIVCVVCKGFSGWRSLLGCLLSVPAFSEKQLKQLKCYVIVCGILMYIPFDEMESRALKTPAVVGICLK